jgi:hypothetical protein
MTSLFGIVAGQSGGKRRLSAWEMAAENHATPLVLGVLSEVHRPRGSDRTSQLTPTKRFLQRPSRHGDVVSTTSNYAEVAKTLSLGRDGVRMRRCMDLRVRPLGRLSN